MNSNNRHFLFWAAYFVYSCIVDLIVDPETTLISEILFFVTQNLFLFYAFLYFLRKFKKNSARAILRSIVTLLIIIALFFGIRYLVRYELLHRFLSPEYGSLPLHEWVVGGVLWLTNYFVFAAAYFYFERAVTHQKQLNKVREENLLAEKRQLELENELLRSKINPHFLYNTLNLFYAKALPLSEPLSEAILKLSDIMRYSLQDDAADSLSAISMELEHVQNVIALARLRFSNKLCLETDFEDFGAKNNVRIVPLVLITLVENMLKHGDLTDPALPARLMLRLEGNNTIRFATYNRKRKVNQCGPKGMGLSNVRARLAAAYGSEWSLIISENDVAYEAILTLPVKPLTHAELCHFG